MQEGGRTVVGQPFPAYWLGILEATLRPSPSELWGLRLSADVLAAARQEPAEVGIPRPRLCVLPVSFARSQRLL